MVFGLKKTIEIRGVKISPPIALAPMVGLSHSALRTLVHDEGGVGLLFTEMLAAARLPHDNARCSPLLIKTVKERPLFYQIVTSSVEEVDPAVEKLIALQADGVDLNLGCPAPLQKRQGAGAALMENQQKVRKILHSLRRSTALPLSVKTRLGDREDPSKLKSVCQFLEDEGVDLITIHARLNGEKFCRRPRWQALADVCDSVSLPIFVNGGIFSVEDAQQSLEQSGAQGLMIGRGAVANPNLCAEIAKEIFGNNIPGSQKVASELYFKFIDLLEERFAPERRLGRLKQFTRYFAAPFTFGHCLASAVQSSQTIEQAKERAADFFVQNGGFHP